jgi:hypothetical protein
MTLVAIDLKAEDSVCKNLKSCSAWANSKTGNVYILGNLERRTLKIEKDFDVSEGDADLIFSYLLGQNDFARIKRDNGTYDIVPIRELKNFQFPTIKDEELKPNLDFYTMEFPLSNKAKVRNAMIMFKKYLSKNGRILESADGTKITVTETGVQLILIKSLVAELNK